MHASQGNGIKVLTLVFVGIVFVPMEALAKSKRSKAPAEAMSIHEKCCYEVGAPWRRDLNTCYLDGPQGTQRGSPRDLPYIACITKKDEKGRSRRVR
jgi:hypothetical protein